VDGGECMGGPTILAVVFVTPAPRYGARMSALGGAPEPATACESQMTAPRDIRIP
jgi:hypothetical protein